MSTLAYAALTNRRVQATSGTSTTTSPPGLKTYADAVAALVPAEVLSLHAVILSITTKTALKDDGTSAVTITDPVTLRWAFWGLVTLSIFLYLVPRFRTKDRFDFARAVIPPAAFVAWTMLQKATAFDAVDPKLGEVPRTVIALFAAVVLGVLAAVLASSADSRTPPSAVSGHDLGQLASRLPAHPTTKLK
jgi:hypothetical protein